MSYTSADRLYGGVHEQALNEVLAAVFAARPRYLNYGSPLFVPTTGVAETQIEAISFPGVPGGIEWSVHLDVPQVDLFPQSMPLPPELGLAAGQLSLTLGATMSVACDRGQGGNLRPSFRIGATAVAHVERIASSIRIVVDDLELVDLQPPELEDLLECLLLKVLRAAIAQVDLPINALTAGALGDLGLGSLAITRGPDIDADQLNVYATV